MSNYLSLIILVLNQENEQGIEIVDLPFGKYYSNFILRVYDQRSGLTSQIDKSTEIIDTTISGFPWFHLKSY